MTLEWERVGDDSKPYTVRSEFGEKCISSADNVHSLQVVISITQGWRTSLFTDRDGEGSIQVGKLMGGTTNTIYFDYNGNRKHQIPVQLYVNTIDVPNDWFIGTRKYIVDYGAPSTGDGYLIHYEGCCRLSTINDGNNDKSFTVESNVKLLANVPYSKHNRSPRVTALPIITLAQSKTPVSFQIPAVDFDGDPISFSVSSRSSLANIVPSRGNFKISPQGQVTWNTNGLDLGFYAVQVFLLSSSLALVALLTALYSCSSQCRMEMSLPQLIYFLTL